jgi:hypothetical protein
VIRAAAFAILLLLPGCRVLPSEWQFNISNTFEFDEMRHEPQGMGPPDV